MKKGTVIIITMGTENSFQDWEHHYFSLAELMHGVEKSAASEKNLRNLKDFISRLERT
ncbi:hypothetical protein [Oceanospirillum sediminis]|uniref:Uncharacterized protein n=1 Tax=Oceanospirillum sediminis TaxID=2760088 RepID=A0A839IPU3_9GAMM|nr:hypothetical protein [Oceanospirillum sediminis]MBB1487275.1 hypothetical protein [Oceanospirillum sediminis]